MATIVLTAVGSLFGPLGAMVGALAGQAVDAQLFRPAGRQGPRLSDLRVQTSSFGTQIPRVHGRMRVAGTVIWATDLFENSETTGGGKGQPSVTTYSYSASFAVALSSRPIASIGRIWADGNLLRGSAGDFKSGIAAFRVHDGSADQPVDPLIAAARGMGMVPAHRGLAYAVFEGLQLADFGNRVPSLTFELIADGGDVPVSHLLESSPATVFTGGNEPLLGGYALSGETMSEAVQPLLDGYGLLVRSVGEGFALTSGDGAGQMLRQAEDLRMAQGERLAAREAERKSVETVPRRLSLRHYDPDRDYQAGTQSAERQGAGEGEAQVDLPATLKAGEARHRAARLLRHHMQGRRTLSLARGWSALTLQPGSMVKLDDHAGGWRIETLEWEGMAVRLGLAGVPLQAADLTGDADGGTGVQQPDAPIGSSHVALVELPQLFASPVSEPQLVVAACGDSRRWRGAAILLRDEVGSHVPLGSIRRPALLGEALSILPPGSSHLFDRTSFVDVQFHDADAAPVPASDAALLGGANGCMIGDELVQYGRADEIGPRRYRLSRLLRARRGTEQAMAGHAVGEVVLVLENDRGLAIGDGRAMPGRTVGIAAQGIGDAVPVEAERVVTGIAMRPPSPAHLRVTGDASIGLAFRWTRRSRLGWSWVDGAETPLAEEMESYAVEITAGSRVVRTETVSAPAWSYAPMLILIDRIFAGGAPLIFSVRQRGTYGSGVAAQITLSI